jgi:hypothetical protein
MGRILGRLKEVDWPFLLACVAWLLLSLLLLVVKVGKKADAVPVLILVTVFLLYMNAGDLFGSFRLYVIATANRRVLAHQFLCASTCGLLSRTYASALATVLGTLALVMRGGRSGLPLLGPFLVKPRRISIVMLGVVAQTIGLAVGNVMSVSMFRETPLPTRMAPVDNGRALAVTVGAAFALLASQMLKVGGGPQTALASALVAAASGVLSPIALVGLVATTSELVPGAVTSLTAFVPQLVKARIPLAARGRCALRVAAWHLTGALAGATLAGTVAELDVVPQDVIPHEFFSRPASRPAVRLT